MPESKRTIFLTHCYKTDLSIIYFGGLNSVTTDALPALRTLYEAGANIIAPRLPHHHGQDSEGKLGLICEVELREFSFYFVKAASLLGKEVKTVGVSAGAILAIYGGLSCQTVIEIVAFEAPFGISGLPKVLGPVTADYIKLLDDDANLDFLFRKVPAPGASSHAVAEVRRFAMRTESLFDEGFFSPTIGINIVLLHDPNESFTSEEAMHRIVNTLENIPDVHANIELTDLGLHREEKWDEEAIKTLYDKMNRKVLEKLLKK